VFNSATNYYLEPELKKLISTYVTWESPRYQGAQPTIDLFTFDPRKTSGFPNVVVVSERQIEVEVPDDFDPRPAQIANLQAEEVRARAAFTSRISEIRRQIGELTAIECAS
jgi:hypothetical protein